MKLKVCGMKYKDNILDVAALRPDYLGFIFYKKSSRFFNSEIPLISTDIKKVGVFVNSEIDYVIMMIEKHQLHAIQLHGDETPEYCETLKSVCHSEQSVESNNEILNQVQDDKKIEFIKVFSIKDDFDFSTIEPYEDACDYFLFDTKGKLPGGNGYSFNWDVLNKYPSTKPFFLSGGIGLQDVLKLKTFMKNNISKYCYAIDINSKFEIKAGLKNKIEIEKFKHDLQH